MHRLLFIGLGGTGGKALRFTWREIDRRLRSKNWSGSEMPDCFQFVHFDLPEKFDGYKDPDVPRVVSMDDKMYFNLAQAPLEYRTYDAQLTLNPTLVGATAGWRPYPVDSIQPPYRGAGQRRAVGRAVGIAELDRIDDAIRRAALRLKSAEAETATRELDRCFKADGRPQSGGQVFVVGSLAGGSGSGIFLDVIDRVRARIGELDWFEHVHFVAVTPDAFLTLAPAERPGAEPNSLAAVAEYIAAFRWEGDLQVHEAALQASVGPVHGTGRRTGKHAYLIGNGNNAITFRSPSDVYRCVGKSLAAYATTPEIQNFFESVVINFDGASAAEGIFFCDPGADSAQPFESFGFGSVSLGRDLLAEYVSQRLARGAVERLLSRDQDRDAQVAEAEFVRSTVATELERFLDSTGLREWDSPEDELASSGSGIHNQIIDALRDRDNLLQETKTLVDRVINGLSGVKTALSADKAGAAFAQEFGARQDEFEKEARQRRTEKARAWTLDVQSRLLDATVTAASDHGLAVAIALLRELRDQLDAAASQLAREKGAYEEKERQALNAVRAVYNDVKDKIVGSSQIHADAAKLRQNALVRRLEQHVRADAIALIKEARTGLVTPLIEALEAFEDRIRADRDDPQGIGSIVDQWPTGTGGVPAHLRPAPNEQLLTPIDSFPDELDTLLCQTLGVDSPRAAFRLAVAELIRGGWISVKEPDRLDVGSQSLFRADPSWNPPLEVAQRPDVPASRARFVTQTTTLGMLDRARNWVHERQGALSRDVSQTIAEYLDPEASGAPGRARAFADALANAMNCARPLVTVNEQIRAAIHQEPTGPPSFVTTGIPIGKRHPARADVERILLEQGVDSAVLASKFTEDETIRELDVFGFLSQSVHPAALASVMGPIAADWSGASATLAGRKAFWRLRRARSLEMFIPLSPSAQRALVKGWYIAGMLGYLRGLDASADLEPTPEVWTGSDWKPFPRPLLGEPVRRSGDILPALLESVSLAFLHVSQAQFDTTRAYSRLIELGNNGHAELMRWVSSGEQPKGAPTLSPELTAPPAIATDAVADSNGEVPIGSSAEARRGAVLEALSRPRATYLGVRNEILDASVWPVDRRWEIAPLVLLSLDSLTAFVRDFEISQLEGAGAAPTIGNI